MSRYTTQLRFLDHWTDEQIGLSDYPIFDSEYRQGLNQKIRSNFAFDELGLETPARFAMRLKNRMRLIMPYYNQLYESALTDISPFLTMRYDVTGKESLADILNMVRNNQRDTESDSKTDTISSELKVGADSKRDTNSVSKSSTQNDNKIASTSGSDSESGSKSDKTDTTHHETVDEINEYGSVDRNTYNSYTESKSINPASDVTTYQNQKTEHEYPIIKGHSFDVTSDTPEGFVLTERIGDDTYANIGNKHREQTDAHTDSDTISGGNTVTHTHDNRDDKRGSDETTHSGNDTKNIESDSNNTSSTYSVDTKNSDSSGVNVESGNTFGEEHTSGTDTSNGTDTESRTGNVGTVGKDIVAEIVKELENQIKHSDKDSLQHFEGFNGKTMSEMLKEWRETFLNIDMMVIGDLEMLFMQVLN